MGADNRQNVQKQRDFQAEVGFSKTGGGTEKSKMLDSHEKSAIAMVLTPANDPGFC
jgi:hypothetical protein